MFLDESTFKLVRGTRETVRRRAGSDRFKASFCVKTVKHPGSVIVWAAFDGFMPYRLQRHLLLQHLLDKSVILLIQKMPLLCVRISEPAALAPSSLMLVASGFVEDDTAAYTIPFLDLLGSSDKFGVAARRKIAEQVVTVSWLAAACLRTQPFNRKDEEQQHSELSYQDVGTTRPVVEASRETLFHRSVKSSL